LLTKFYVEEHVKSALAEDIGFEDISTGVVSSKLSARLNTRSDGVLCGCEVFKTVFELLDPEIKIKFHFQDGDAIKNGDKIATLKGPAKWILTGERVALNYIQRMSAIATETRKYQDAIKPYKARIADTRKTTPNFRAFEKYAVKCGGGMLHRFNLSDCVMIKDNHIALAGSITAAVEKINTSFTHKIEVECDTLEQVKEALTCGVDIIMLDNMSLADMRHAVELINGKAIVEASGGVNLETVNGIAACGVDIISSSAIVANAGTLDLALDV
jgi:nicotinate-nucleotide pyrophosphorylase (carboxylating)